MKFKASLLAPLLVSIPILLFQNCGQGFKIVDSNGFEVASNSSLNPTAQSSDPLSSNGTLTNLPTLTPTPAPLKLLQNKWKAMSLVGAPSARESHSIVAAGSKIIIFGGGVLRVGQDDGYIYDPAQNTWKAISKVGAPSPRLGHSAVWTGSRMIIWGGANASALSDGGIYDPVTDTWSPMSTVGAPVGRFGNSAVWTGTKMLIFGGNSPGSSQLFSAGGIYDPATNTWSPMSAVNAPSARVFHSAIWTGSKMVVWGGSAAGVYQSDGGSYDPVTDTWTATSLVGAPVARATHSAVWTGSRMIVFGGLDTSSPRKTLNDGASFDPVTNSWVPISSIGSPVRQAGLAVWTGNAMIIWGGLGATDSAAARIGGIYNPVTNVWTTTVAEGAPEGRYHNSAEVEFGAWTGAELVVFGGNGYSAPYLGTGGVFY